MPARTTGAAAMNKAIDPALMQAAEATGSQPGVKMDA